MAMINYLDRDGARYIVRKVKEITGQPVIFADVTNKPNTIAGYGITDAASITDVTALGDSVTIIEGSISDIENEIQALRNADIAVYHFKGSLENYAALENVATKEVGDVYNLLDTGKNVAWTEDGWDELGGYDLDLSDYVKDEDIVDFVKKDQFEALTEIELEGIFAEYFPEEVETIEDFKAALNADKPIVSVALDDNLVLDSQINIPTGKKAFIDLNGNTLTTNGKVLAVNGGELVIEGEGTIRNTVSGVEARPIQAVNGGIVTINSGNIINTKDCAVTAASGAEVTVNGGYVEAQEVGVLGTTNSTININGGIIKGIDNFAVGGNGSEGLGGTTINITGGHLEGNITSPGYVACAVYHPQAGTLNVSGGEIIAHNGCGILMRGGQLNMTGGTITVDGAADLLGKVGDSRVVVGPHGVIYDQGSNYPGVDSLGINITGGTITSANGKSIDVITKDANHVPNLTVGGTATLTPPYEG